MHAKDATRLLRRQADRLRLLDVIDSRQPAFGRWFRETKTALDDIFGPATGPNREFQLVIFQPLRPSKIDPDADWREAYERGVPVAFSFLDSVIEDLSAQSGAAGGDPSSEPDSARRAPVTPSAGAARKAPAAGPGAGRVTASDRGACLVVGSDEKASAEVAGFLEKIGADAVALRAAADGGAAVLLDRLDEGAGVAFAVILLTAGEGAGAGARAQARTARASRPSGRNSTLELGILLGRLGRKNVCVLHQEGVELPPGCEAVVCVPLDGGGNWKFGLARALTGAGLPVDLNKAAL